MIDMYDNAKSIIRSCEDLIAIVMVMEETESSDTADARACLTTARCALTSIVSGIREAAEAIADRASSGSA